MVVVVSKPMSSSTDVNDGKELLTDRLERAPCLEHSCCNAYVHHEKDVPYHSAVYVLLSSILSDHCHEIKPGHY